MGLSGMGCGAPFAAWLGSFKSPDQRASGGGASRAWGGRRRRWGARPRRPELGELGLGVVVHGSKNSWVLRAPVDAMVALAHSYAVRVGSGHGGVMAGGEELSGSTEPAVTGRNRHRGERGSVRRLTARPTSARARSGMLCSSGIDDDDPR